MPEPWGGHDNGRIPLSELRPLKHAVDGNGQPAYHLRLRKDAAMALDRLLVKAGDDGYQRRVTDAYRDYDTQVRLKADKGVYAATPGTSNHGWAMAADCDYYSSEDAFGRWLWANEAEAREHGWYPPSWTHDRQGIEEPWHWEYDDALDQHRYELPEDDVRPEDIQAIAEAVRTEILGTEFKSGVDVRQAIRETHRLTSRLVDMVEAGGSTPKAKAIAKAVRAELAKALED